MPSHKCGGCARFISPAEAAVCSKCKALYHRPCVALPATKQILTTWCCPECNKNVLRDNRPETPVRGKADSIQPVARRSPELQITSGVTTDATSVPSMEHSLAWTGELRLFREEMRAEFRSLHTEIHGLRAEMVELRASLTLSDERINDLDTRIASVDTKLSQKIEELENQQQTAIADLKCQLNDRDQELLLNDVEVTGIPEVKHENVLHIVKVLSTTLGISMDETDVVHAERVGSTRRNRIDHSPSADPKLERPRYITVRFARRAVRDALLRAARVRRGLTTDDLKMGNSSSRIYMNERLTRTNRQLFYRARQASTQHNWKYVWTRDGNILARKEEGHRVLRIRHIEDIPKFFG